MTRSNALAVRATRESVIAGTETLAISIKQPWAALVVAGLKTVEVRAWPTDRRGPVLIHAAKQPDTRPEGWNLVTTAELKALAALRGGIIGAADLTACVRYATAEEFAGSTGAHKNNPTWFAPAGLYGFVFQNPRPVEYHSCPGRTFFFAVSPRRN